MLLNIRRTPPSPNEIKRQFRNPHVYKQLRHQWGWELKAAAGLDRFRLEALADTQTKMRVKIHIAHKQKFDPDNLVGSVKVILDALREIHFLADDSPELLELEVTQEQSKTPYTLVLMEEARRDSVPNL